jgi:hypothetical protein
MRLPQRLRRLLLLRLPLRVRRLRLRLLLLAARGSWAGGS